MTEKHLLNKILLALPEDCRLFRNNVGTGWAGGPITKTPNSNGGIDVLVRNARPLRAGLVKGSGDLIGWTTVEITPEMVGKKIAVFTSLEAKVKKTRKSPGQINFAEKVQNSGGISGFPSSVEQSLNILEWIK